MQAMFARERKWNEKNTLHSFPYVWPCKVSNSRTAWQTAHKHWHARTYIRSTSLRAPSLQSRYFHFWAFVFPVIYHFIATNFKFYDYRGILEKECWKRDLHMKAVFHFTLSSSHINIDTTLWYHRHHHHYYHLHLHSSRRKISSRKRVEKMLFWRSVLWCGVCVVVVRGRKKMMPKSRKVHQSKPCKLYSHSNPFEIYYTVGSAIKSYLAIP